MNPNQPAAILLMGVSGCGKTSVGIALSDILGWPFFDGDDYHPKENVAKMAAGIPLNDEDRFPWLKRINQLISENLGDKRSLIVACSALKTKYRDILGEGNPNTVFVYLKGDFDLIFQRMQERSDHYMKAGMLESQFAALEEPEEALTVQIEANPEKIAQTIIEQLNLQS